MKTLRSDSQHPWHRFPGRSFILALLILASGCTTTIPRTDLPLITNESCGDQVKVVTVPLPVIASSPNEGITAGALSAFLIHDTRDEIYSLLAPQLNYNQNFGFTGTLYGSVNPSPEQNIEFNLSQSQKKNFDYEARIRDISLMNGNLELKGFLGWFADGSSRFFGFHARTPGEQETNYTNREITYNLSATWFLGRHYYLELGTVSALSPLARCDHLIPFITEKLPSRTSRGGRIYPHAPASH